MLFYLTKAQQNGMVVQRDWQEPWDRQERFQCGLIPTLCVIWSPPTAQSYCLYRHPLSIAAYIISVLSSFELFHCSNFFPGTLLLHHSSTCSFDTPHRSVPRTAYRKSQTLCFFIFCCPPSFFFRPLGLPDILFFLYIHYMTLPYFISFAEHKYLSEVK